MNLKRWIARREAHWQSLETLLYRVKRRGIQRLTAAEVRQLASLYRSVSADLARAQTHRLGQRLTQMLQDLTAQGYHQIYQGQRHQEWAAVREFLLWGLPAALQRNGLYIAIATLLFLGMGLIGGAIATLDPQVIPVLVPAHLIETVRKGELWMGSILGQEPIASASIMINNLLVSFGAIAGGITLGLWTVYILVFNGLFLGIVATLVAQHDLAYPFWAFVLPHGSLELPAICIAGGAGLLIARGLLYPGRYTRLAAVQYYSNQAAQLTVGVVLLLIIAGFIEGLFSPNPLVPDALKYLAGGMLFFLLIGYGQRQKG
ncbi:MAG: stage II sporulation protein M [Cyanobacteria bacterium P01_G01_bin.54]